MSEAKSIFISYAHEDADAARRIAEALRGFGMEVFFDEHELRGGDAWDAKLRKQIRECSLFLPVISAQTEERLEGYFRREWKLAVNRMDDMAAGMSFLLPVVIDDTPEYGAAVPESFTQVQWIRLENGVPTPEFVTQVKRLLDAPRRAVAGSGAGWSPTSGRAGESTRPETPPGSEAARSDWASCARSRAVGARA